MEQNVHPMVSVPDAIRTVLQETAKVVMTNEGGVTDTVSADAPWKDILNRVLAEEVKMSSPGYPPYNASIMDGYAIRCEDFSAGHCPNNESKDWTHQVLDRVYAGDTTTPKNAPLTDDLPTAYYITTGAMVPPTCNCVVPIEECTVSPDKSKIAIHPSATIQSGKWIRPIGCDIPDGSVVIPSGHVMEPVALGLLKQSGADCIRLKRPLSVGVMSTGNELILGSKDATQPGQIPDVNRPVLLSLLSTFGNCEPVDLGVERDDDVQAMARTVDSALEKCDVIITTGGISMGETDIVEQVLVEHCGGKLHFGRMHMKPGKPTTFVTISRAESTKLVFAMPGNPVSAVVCTCLLVKPCLDLLFNGIDKDSKTSDPPSKTALDALVDNAYVHPEIQIELSNDFKLDSERPEYHRVVLNRQIDGSFAATSTGVQQSSRLISLRDAQGLLVLPQATPEKPKALKGEKYPVLVLSRFHNLIQTRLKDSLHLRQKLDKSFRVAVIRVFASDTNPNVSMNAVSAKAQKALCGSKSGAVTIVCEKQYSGPVEDLYSFATDSNDADFILVVCMSERGSFQFQLDVSVSLKSKLKKVADSLSLQLRQGAASEQPEAAIFETVVGYAPEGKGAILVCLSEKGLSGGLGNIRGLLKHSLNVARDKPHDHHHGHNHNDHKE